MTTSFFPSPHIINRFLEDTCVIVAVAYLLSRGARIPSLFSVLRTRDLVSFAAVFGVIGASEFAFPGDRYPYVPYTLAASFAGYVGGVPLGLSTAVCIAIVALVAWIFGVTIPTPLLTSLSLVIAGLIGGGLWLWRRRVDLSNEPTLGIVLFGAFAAGGLAEFSHSMLRYLFLGHGVLSLDLTKLVGLPVVYSAASNGFGCLLLALVLDDAYKRRRAVQLQLEAEREVAALRLSQMGELQARLHPHFLFNVLAGIAGLCIVKPAEAERGVTRLSTLLRGFLRTPTESSTSLREELDIVHSYLDIEQMRLGERLTITEDITAELLNESAPRFCIQVLVENAIQHGFGQSPKSALLSIRGRLYRNHVLLVVTDNGVGVSSGVKERLRIASQSPDLSTSNAPHGLELLVCRLHLAYGRTARLRLSGIQGGGTFCAIRLPRKNTRR